MRAAKRHPRKFGKSGVFPQPVKLGVNETACPSNSTENIEEQFILLLHWMAQLCEARKPRFSPRARQRQRDRPESFVSWMQHSSRGLPSANRLDSRMKPRF